MFENVDEDWIQSGNYQYLVLKDCFRIFPKKEDGTTIPIWVKRVWIRIRRQYGDAFTEIAFKYYKHRRNYYWKDCRPDEFGKDQGYCSVFHARDELARLLFDGKKEKAEDLMAQVMALI